jgi:hypothetical protein
MNIIFLDRKLVIKILLQSIKFIHLKFEELLINRFKMEVNFEINMKKKNS